MYEGIQEAIVNGDNSRMIANMWYREDVDFTTVDGAMVNPYALWFCITADDVVTIPLYSQALQPLVSTYPNNLSEVIAVLAQDSSKLFFEVVNAVAKTYDDDALREHVRRCRDLSAAELEAGVRYYRNMLFGPIET